MLACGGDVHCIQCRAASRFLATLVGSTLPLPLARDALLSPPRAIQGELLALAGAAPFRLVQAGDALAATAERARLAPVVLAAEQPFADFMAALARAFPGRRGPLY